MEPKKAISFTKIGQHIAQGRCYISYKNEDEAIKNLDSHERNTCLLTYIALLLEPISEHHKKLLEQEKEKEEESKKLILKKKLEWIDDMYKKYENNRFVKKILSHIRDDMKEFIGGYRDCCIYDNLHLRDISDLTDKEILSIRFIGKITLKKLRESLENSSQKERNRHE